MPDRGFPIGGMDADIEQAAAEVEEAIQHLGQGEPGAQRLAVEIKALLPQLLRPIAHIPGLQGGARQGFQVLEFLLCCAVAGGPQVFQQRFHGLHRRSHLAGQADFRPVAIAQQGGLLLTQGQDLPHQVGVVVLAAGGPADEAAVDRFAQIAPAAVLQKGAVARVVQAHQPGAIRRCGLLVALAPG